MPRLYEAEGRTVPQEDGRPWPPEGMVPASTNYIRRRLRDGDLTADRRAAKKPPTPASPAEPAAPAEAAAPTPAPADEPARKKGDK